MNGLMQINSLLLLEKQNSLFHKPRRKHDLPFLLRRLLIKKHKVETVKLVKFFGVWLDKNHLAKIILNILKIKSPKTLIYYIGSNYF